MARAPAQCGSDGGAGAGLWPTRSEWRGLLLLAGAGLALRLALIAGARTYVIPPKDQHYLFAHEYGRIARSLALGRGYASPFELDRGGPTVMGAPLFPFYLSLLFRVFGVYSPNAAAALLVTNSLASVATALLVFVLGKRLFGAPVAWWAAAIFCFDPTPVWYSVNCTWETSLSLAALTLISVLFLWLDERPTGLRGAASGLALGGLAHLNAWVLLVSASLGGWMLLRSQGRRVALLRALGAAAIVGTVVITPWSVRSSLVAGRLIVVRGAGEMTFYSGNHPGATGDPIRDDKAAYVAQNPGEREMYYRMGEAAYQRYCRNRAFAFIGAQPWAYGGLVLRRLGVFWLGDLWTAVEWRGGLRSSVPLLQVKKAANMLPLPFALAGLLVALRRRWRVWPLVVPILAYSVPFVLIYCAYGRYRVPIHGFLVLLASVALYAAWERLARGRRAKPGEGAT